MIILEEIRNLLWNNEYERCISLCKEKLDKDSNNYLLWYYLFLASNKNFTEPIEYIQNELAFKKAFELSKKEDKEKVEISYVILSELKNLPHLANLYLSIEENISLSIECNLKKSLEDKTSINVDFSIDFISYIMDFIFDENNKHKLYMMFLYLVTLHCKNTSLQKIFNKVNLEDETSEETIRNYLDGLSASNQSLNANLDLSKLEVGSIFTFGKYSSEPMEWHVLEIKNNKALIITDKIIEARIFDSLSNNYEKSEIRKWLNTDFYNSFTKQEKNRIIKAPVDNSLKTTCDTMNKYVCNAIEDYVFLLSVEEAKKYFKDDTARISHGTEHAIKNGLRLHEDNNNSYWWLRSPYGGDGYSARIVGTDGKIYSDGVFLEFVGIRPACIIKIKP